MENGKKEEKPKWLILAKSQMASSLLYATNNPNILDAIKGNKITKDFVEFCKEPTITILDVVKGNYTQEDLKMNLGEKLRAVYGLLDVNENYMPKVGEFVKKIRRGDL